MGLRSIAYVSIAVRLLDGNQLLELLNTSRERNRRDDITGLLLYSNGRFIQCIEGPEAALRNLYSDISVDSRHKNVTLLVDESISGRDFGSWNMGYVPLGGKAFDSLLASKWPLKEAGGFPASESKGKQLLQIVWEQIASDTKSLGKEIL
jgi:Sensors of blue-light using FAD